MVIGPRSATRQQATSHARLPSLKAPRRTEEHFGVRAEVAAHVCDGTGGRASVAGIARHAATHGTFHGVA